MKLIPALEVATTTHRPVAMTENGCIVSDRVIERVFLTPIGATTPASRAETVRRIVSKLAPGLEMVLKGGGAPREDDFTKDCYVIDVESTRVVVTPKSWTLVHQMWWKHSDTPRLVSLVGEDQGDVFFTGNEMWEVDEWLEEQQRTPTT